MENEENEDDEESSIIPFVNLLKLKVINFKVSPAFFKVYIPPKLIQVGHTSIRGGVLK